MRIYPYQLCDTLRTVIFRFFAVRLTAVLHTGCREQNLFIPEISAVAALDPNTLREDFAGQVFLLRHFSGVVAPIIAGHHAGTFRGLKV